MKIFQSIVSKITPSPKTLGEGVVSLSKLSPEIVADAIENGAVWLQRGGRGKILRCYRPSELLKPQDKIAFYYDPRVLAMPVLQEAECLFETNHYGIWMKASNVVSQGTQTGDHTSLLRFVEKKRGQETFLVHRLDRETTGLMIVAYNGKAAGVLSEMFQKHQIKKTYQAIVKGELPKSSKAEINVSLDDKAAITHYEVLDVLQGMSLLEVQIETGRLHQIRRHLDHIGYPVMGDPKYGRGNKNKDGLKLLAKSLSFQDPWSKKSIVVEARCDLTISE